MSFAGLKRKSPSASPEVISAEAFIQQAEYYARGMDNVVKLAAKPEKVEGSALKHATYMLSDEAKDKLEVLSQYTGISRSRLIRIWLSELEPEAEVIRYKQSRCR